MNTNIFLLFFFLFSLSATTTSVAQKQCGRCRDMEVPYPLSTSDGCGLSGYRLTCGRDGLGFRTAGGMVYKVSSITPKERSLIINPPNINKECRTSDVTGGGLVIPGGSPFNISGRNTVFLLGCGRSILRSPLNCSASSPCNLYVEKAATGCRGSVCCSYLKDFSMTNRRIPLRDGGGCTAYTSVVDFKDGQPQQSWKLGVQLQWIPPM